MATFAVKFRGTPGSFVKPAFHPRLPVCWSRGCAKPVPHGDVPDFQIRIRKMAHLNPLISDLALILGVAGIVALLFKN
ncbi:MAG: hypothetical protein ACLR8Y_00150 [Alistipes indistinctus]